MALASCSSVSSGMSVIGLIHVGTKRRTLQPRKRCRAYAGWRGSRLHPMQPSPQKCRLLVYLGQWLTRSRKLFAGPTYATPAGETAVCLRRRRFIVSRRRSASGGDGPSSRDNGLPPATTFRRPETMVCLWRRRSIVPIRRSVSGCDGGSRMRWHSQSRGPKGRSSLAQGIALGLNPIGGDAA
jgi:hypothetical protein